MTLGLCKAGLPAAAAYIDGWQREACARSKDLATEGRALHLAGDGGDDGLCVDQRGVAQVVQSAAAQDLGTSLPPHGLTELHAAASYISDWLINIASAPQRRI